MPLSRPLAPLSCRTAVPALHRAVQRLADAGSLLALTSRPASFHSYRGSNNVLSRPSTMSSPDGKAVARPADERASALTAEDLSSSYIRRTSLAIGARRHHTHHSPTLSPISPVSPGIGPGGGGGGSPRASFTTSFLSRTRPQDPEMGGQSHVSFRQSFGTSAARPAAVEYTDSPMGTPPLRRETHGDDSGFGFSVSSGDSDCPRRPRRRSSLTGPKYKWLSNNTGDEPGVDVRSERDEEMYKHLRGKANVTVRRGARDGEG